MVGWTGASRRVLSAVAACVAAVAAVGSTAQAAGLPVVVPIAAPSVAPALTAAPSAAGTFVSLAPARLLDTRSNVGGAGPVPAGGVVHLNVLGRGGVPASGVSAVVLNVTVVYPKGGGFVTVWPDGTPRPTASNLNFVAGQTVPNLVVVKVGSDGAVALANSSGGTVQLLADVSGYYWSGTPTVAGAFASLAPARVLDTRSNVGGPGPVQSGGVVHLRVLGRGGVPASGVSAVVLNVTVVYPTGSGFVTVWPDGTSRPTTSNLNFVAGRSVPNLVMAKVGSDGAVALANSSGGTVQLLADVAGYYLSGTPSVAGAFAPLAPARLLDTRRSLGIAVYAESAMQLGVLGRGGVPSSGVSAVVLNVTVVNPQTSGFVRVWPDQTNRPATSNLNFVAGQAVANLVVARVGPDGAVELGNSSGGTVDLIADVAGYYRPLPSPVTGAKATTTTSTSMALSWTNPTTGPYTGVVIRRANGTTAPSDPTSGTAVATTTGVTTSYTDTGLTAGSTYSYGLFATDGTSWAPAAKLTVRLGLMSWGAPQTIDPNAGSLQSISCPTATFCAALDYQGNAQTFNGTTWSRPTKIEPGAPIFESAPQVSCASATFCAAVNSHGDVITYDGTAWSPPTNLQDHPIISVSCPTTTFCVAVTDWGDELTFNGTSWSPPRNLGTGNVLESVSCPTTSFCVAVDYVGNEVTFDGTSWSTPRSIEQNTELVSVSCSSVSFCAAVDTNGSVLTFNGTTWGAPHSIDTGPLTSVSCVTSTFCVAADFAGHVMTLTTVGWSAPTTVNGAGTQAVSCPTTTFCAVSDGRAAVVTFDGTHWGAPTTADPAQGPLQAVSCPTTSFCAAVDGTGHALTFNGTTWSAPVSIDTNVLNAVSCPTSTFCVAVGDGGASIFNGSAWTAPRPIDGMSYMYSVSCASSSFCVAVGELGAGITANAVTFNGASWGPAARIGEWVRVSCPSITFCMGADANGTDMTFNGATWSTPRAIEPTNAGPYWLSCPTSSFCAAADGAGRVVTWTGSTWSAPQPVDTTSQVVALSCASSTSCTLIDDGGHAMTYNGSTWSPPVVLETPQGQTRLQAVSCPSPVFCVVVETMHSAAITGSSA